MTDTQPTKPTKPTRLSNEDRVKAIHPKAKAKRYTQNGRGGVYYLVWTTGGMDGKRLAEGATEAKAWKAAAEVVERMAEAEKAKGE
jgi:hypothetical protein